MHFFPFYFISHFWSLQRYVLVVYEEKCVFLCPHFPFPRPLAVREIKVIECFLSTSNSHFFFWNSLCLTRSSLSSFPWGTSYPSPYGFGKLQVVTYFEGREGKGKFSWQGPDRKKSTPLFFQFRNLKSSSGKKIFNSQK